MPRSTKLFLFPDVNVWIALTYRAHVSYESARIWLDSLPEDTNLCFCRFTQIGFLRLLTTPAVMGNAVLAQKSAWETYDSWLEDGHASFIEEPSAVERIFRTLSISRQVAPKDWADSYISAFAQATGLRLVTFDQVLHRRTPNSILLAP